MNISDEAVEAALTAWAKWPDGVGAREQMVTILEAAAPHLMTPTRVTTEDELDALPAWSVVLSEAYTHHKSGQRISFQRWDDGDWHRGGRASNTHPDNFLPATVLHIGGTHGDD